MALVTFVIAGLFSLSMIWIALSFYFWGDGISKAQNYKEFNQNNMLAFLPMTLALFGIAAISFEIPAMVFVVDAFAIGMGFL